MIAAMHPLTDALIDRASKSGVSPVLNMVHESIRQLRFLQEMVEQAKGADFDDRWQTIGNLSTMITALEQFVIVADNIRRGMSLDQIRKDQNDRQQEAHKQRRKRARLSSDESVPPGPTGGEPSTDPVASE